jgi:hypothetical protein
VAEQRIYFIQMIKKLSEYPQFYNCMVFEQAKGMVTKLFYLRYYFVVACFNQKNESELPGPTEIRPNSNHQIYIPN